jgi:predicted RND superfamily exporter protein
MGEANLWWSARNELVPPVLAVSAMTAVGFGIFTLSAFPPTQRFGLAVILGTATAAFMALVVLPLLASADR